MRIDVALARLAWAPRAGPRPAHGLAVIHDETIVPASLDATFAFFADASNLERLTPAWLNFRIRTPMPVTMAEGLEIEYRIVLHGVPVRWLSRIDVWQPGVRFVDRQVLGPYRWWRHEHRFEPLESGGTRVIDHVEFRPRVNWLTGALVRRDVRRIFAFRGRELSRLFQS